MTSNPITPEEIVKIHSIIEKRFKLPSGHVKIGELETLVDKCSRIPFSTEQVGIFEQAAILFEGIIRLHIFTDGNKRTALETTRQFLNRNFYVLIVPLSGVNFIYKIAQDCTPDTKKILHKITNWLTEHSAKTSQWYRIVGLLGIHIYWPVFWARFFSRIRLRRCGRWIIKKYLMSEDSQVTEFMIEIYEKQFNLFELADKQHKK